MEFLSAIKALIPDYAKDIRLNLDGTIARSSLEGTDAVGVALARKLAEAGRPVRVVLGMDTRESGPWITSTLIDGLCEGGAEIEFAGVITTPAIAFLAR